jgi:hypothetical protein
MALLTVGSKLALVDVGVAVLAALSYVGENGPDMAFGAWDGYVHAPQRIFGLVMIELWDRADRFPRIGRVAVLAR